MKLAQEIYNSWSLLLQSATLIAAAYFAYRQNNINNRLKELQDYVGLSIVPLNNLRLQVNNVGRTNLYLHKWEVGESTQTFTEPILVSAENRTNLIITLQPNSVGQKRAKFYLTDESRKKFLSEGEVMLTPISATPISSQILLPSLGDSGTTANPQIAGVKVEVNMTAWSYRTVPFEWFI